MQPNRMGDAGDHFRKDVDAIRDDLALLRSDLVAAFRDLIGAARSGAGEAREKLLDAVQGRLEELNSAAGDLGEHGRRAVGQVQRYAQDRPLQTAAAAFGAGVLVGVLLSRRWD